MSFFERFLTKVKIILIDCGFLKLGQQANILVFFFRYFQVKMK